MTSFLVEFHCHTDASKDSLTPPADLLAAARRKGIDRLIITDHNSIAGARAAQSLDPELVIVGSRRPATARSDPAAQGTGRVHQCFTPV